MLKRIYYWICILSALALWLLIIPASHAACARYEVEVEPFTYTEGTASFRHLTEVENGGRPLFGVVHAEAWLGVYKCTISFGYRNVRLLLATELKRDYCAWNHIREHELRHVELYRDALAYAPERIAELARTLEPREAARQYLREVAQRHRDEIDTDEEYDTNRTACNGAVLATTGARRFR